MHPVEILRGTFIIVFIVALAGVIAYIGDRVGHQVGRKRLTILNIRPRYTSTIVAVGTGMLIALIITLVAIFASNEVKTAFFRLNALNSEIQKAQARAQALENKVNNEHVVFGLDSLIEPFPGSIPMNSPAAIREERIREFYRQTVAYVNSAYTHAPFDLKPFRAPRNLNKTLSELADAPSVQAQVAQTPILLLALAAQNLYPHDRIHFSITEVPDRLIVPGGQAIASLVIPGGKNVSAQLAMLELLDTDVPREMVDHGMPPSFAVRVSVLRTLPSPSVMRTTLTAGSGDYLLTAFAATDIYPHTYGVPVVVTLQKAPQ